MECSPGMRKAGRHLTKRFTLIENSAKFRRGKFGASTEVPERLRDPVANCVISVLEQGCYGVNSPIVDCVWVCGKHSISQLLRSVNFRICTPRPPDKLNCLDNPSLRVWSKCKCGLRIQKEDENEDYGEDQDEAFPTHGNPGSCRLLL
jgi:hypothetical protein